MSEFFAPNGCMRQVLWNANARESKQFEIGNPVLARYFWELIESGVSMVQFNLDGMRERELGNGGAVVECVRAGMVYWYKDTVVRIYSMVTFNCDH